LTLPKAKSLHVFYTVQYEHIKQDVVGCVYVFASNCFAKD